MFLKAPSRVEIFKNTLPDVPLPPQPVITRWGTWLNAVVYISSNYTGLKSGFEHLEASEAASISICNELLNSTVVRNEIS